MKTGGKKRWLFVAAPIVVLVVAVLAFSQLDIGTSVVREKVVEAVSGRTEAEFEIERVKGNPLGGYRLEGIRLTDSAGEEVFSARSLGVSVAFSSLLGGQPSLKQMVLEGARTDVPALMALLPERAESVGMKARIEQFLEGGAELHLPVQRVEVRNSTFVTARGDVGLEEAVLDLAKSGVKAQLQVVFQELPLSGKGEVQWDEKGMNLDGLALRLGTGKVEASGGVFPDLELAGGMEEIDLGELARLWPELAERGFGGKFGTTFKAEGTWTKPVLEGVLAFEGGELSGFSLDDAGSAWRYEGAARSLRMQDVTARLMGIPVSGKMGFVFSQLPPNLDIDLGASDVALDRVAERVPALEGARGSVEEVKVRLTGRTDSIKGNVLLRIGDIEVMDQKLGAGKAELVFDGTRNARFQADSTWLGRPITGRGTFPLEAGRPVNMVLEAPGVPLKDLAVIRPELASLKLQGSAAVQLVFSGIPGKDLGLKGVFSSDRLRVKGELFQGTRAEVSLQGEDLFLKSLKTSWNKAQIGGKGVVKGLTSGKPELALDTTVTGLNLESLRSFAPGLAASDVKGAVSGSARVTGAVSSPKTVFSLSSPVVTVADGFRVQEIRGQGELTMVKDGVFPVAGPFGFSAKALNLAGADLGAASLKGSLGSGNLTLDEVTAGPGGGFVKGAGTLSLGVKPAKIDLKGSFGEVDVARVMPHDVLVPISGKASGTFAVAGALDAPQLGGELSLPRLVVSGMALEGFKATLAGTPEEMRVDPIVASVGGAPLTGKVHVVGAGEALEAEVFVQGKALDLGALASGMKQAKELAVKGKMDLDLQASMRDGKVSGKGTASAPSVEAMGMTLTELSVPFVAEEGTARLQDASALFYGGKVTLVGEADLARSAWKGSLRVAGTDMKPVTVALMKGKGNLTGKGDLNFDGNGNMKIGTFLGSGNLSVGEGQLEGFKGLDALSALHGSSSLGYKSILSNFTVNSKTLQLLPGTRVLAPQKDPVYRYLDADGALGFDKALDMNVSGNVNIQSLNAFLGGIQGLWGGAGESPEAMLQGLLGGLTGGMTTQDFRDVRFRLEGTTEKPRIKDLKIEQKLAPAQQESSTPGKDIQAAPQEQQPSSPEELLQKKLLEKLFGD